MSQRDRNKVTPDGPAPNESLQVSPEDRSPPELDEAILKAARRAVRFHWLTVLLEKLHLDSSTTWQLLVALAIGLLLGLGLEPFIGEALRPEPSPLIHAGDPPPKGIPAGQKNQPTSPERWLQSIAALVLRGMTSEAESELRAFRQRYPDHRPPQP